MFHSNVNILLGNNASGKTRYLFSKVQTLSQNGVVLHNLNNDYTMHNLDINKLELLNEACNSGYESKDGSFLDKSGIERILLGKILSVGDYLILDEIDSLLPRQRLIDMCSAIRDVSNLWKEVWLSGHSPILLQASTEKKFYFMESNRIQLEEGVASINEYLTSV